MLFGENEAEYGNPSEDMSSAQRDWSFFTESDADDIFLAAASLSELKENFGISSREINTHFPADLELPTKKKVQAHYLGHYLK